MKTYRYLVSVRDGEREKVREKERGKKTVSEREKERDLVRVRKRESCLRRKLFFSVEQVVLAQESRTFGRLLFFHFCFFAFAFAFAFALSLSL